jgi:6-pyruvoyl-tetrahydropterin synthase
MVVDFGGPEFAIVKAFCATIDHACLIWRNDPLLKPLMDDPQTRVIPMTNHPTAEEIAGLISVIAKQSFVDTLHVFGGSVTVYETATARATVQWLPDEPRGLE